MISRKCVNSGPGFRTSTNKRPVSSLYDDSFDVDELGAETEAEKQMKVLLQKQLNTKLSIKEQFSQHRAFCCPSTFNPLSELIRGSCTLEEFKDVEKDEELRQELQRAGLSENEIMDYISFKSGKRKGNVTIDPAVWENNIKAIEEKIKTHNEDLQKPQRFQSIKKLTRHEMEIEKSLYAGYPDKSKLSTLISVLEDNQPKDVNDAFKHIKSLSQKLLETRKKKNRNKNSKNQNLSSENTHTSSPEEPQFQYDSNIHHVVIPLEESEVEEKRLNIEEIRKLPRFENYKTGDPSTTLYLKNLHPKITIHELRSLFGTFQEENKLPIDYRICSGRMKGQAFVKFSDVKIAEKALKYVNGYSLRNKPVIIEFGKKS